MKTQIHKSRLVSGLLLGLLTLLTACQPIQPSSASQTKAKAAETDQTAANKAAIQRLYEGAFNQHNTAFFAEVMDQPNLVNHELDYGADGLSPDVLMAGFPDLQVKIERIVAEGEMVVAQVIFSGTHKGEFLGVAPTGKPMSFALIDIFRFKEGKVVEVWHYIPVPDILEQIGGTQ